MFKRFTQTLSTLVLVLALLSAPVSAQIPELRLPISLDADSTDYDGKNSMLMFRGLRLSQGTMGVEADEGRASKLDFEDSVWQFSGNVVIDVENGRIECDSADLKFSNHQLILAVIEGAPATFEMRRTGNSESTYAEAGKLRYDLATATIEFAENAVINEGGNQISSEFLVYNILEQRINAVSSGDPDDKVKIIYTPPPAEDVGSSEDATGAALDQPAAVDDDVTDQPAAEGDATEQPAEAEGDGGE